MKNNLQRFDYALPVGNLSSYIHWTHQIPLLSAEEEQDLATRLYENNDLEAARQLILPHLRFVVRIARGYSGYGLAQADLVQEGNIGLMKAVKRFDPKVGVRLVTFAIHWIRAEIHEFIIRNWRIVKIATTKAQRKLFFNLRKAAKKLGWLSNDEVNMVAEQLQVKAKDVRHMEQRLSNFDQSFDTRDSEEDNQIYTPASYLADPQTDPAKQLESSDWQDNRQQHLQQALLTLDARSRDIVEQRWLSANKPTLHDLAAKYQISAERIRQLEKNAMEKMKKLLDA